MSGIWNFVKNHRRKFFIVSAVVGGAAIAANYAFKKFEGWEKHQMKAMLSKEKKQQYFSSIMQSCSTTCRNLSVKLKHTISKILDVDSITMTLKANPPNKIELWEHLKIITFTRNVAFIVSNVLLAVLVHVQLGVVGGHLFRAQMTDGSGTGQIDSTVQEKYLSACNYLLNEGVEELIAYLEPIVKTVLNSIPLTKMITPFELQALFAEIEKIIVKDIRQAPQIITRCMISSHAERNGNETSFDDNWNDALLQQMNSETVELLETNEVLDIICDSLHIGWDFMLDSVESPFNVADLNKLPVAKIIPVLNGFYVSDCSKKWIERIIANRNLPLFVGNVYESFCQ